MDDNGNEEGDIAEKAGDKKERVGSWEGSADVSSIKTFIRMVMGEGGYCKHQNGWTLNDRNIQAVHMPFKRLSLFLIS